MSKIAISVASFLIVAHTGEFTVIKLHLAGRCWCLLHLTYWHRCLLLTVLAELFHYALNAFMELRRYVEGRVGVHIESTFCLSKVHLII